jgi:hypothetical protein
MPLRKTEEPVRYLSAEDMTADDFGVPFTNRVGEAIYDAKTHNGQWATMTQKSFAAHTNGKLGLGLGQKYVRNAIGHLLKTEG